MVASSDEEFQGFGKSLTKFYKELAQNNTREWFKSHRQEFDDWIANPLDLLGQALEPKFGEIKIFRPFKDVRFSKDKSPIKEQAGMTAIGKDGSSYYVEMSARGMFIAAGMWDPKKDELDRFRELVDDPKKVRSIHKVLDEIKSHGFEMTGPIQPLKSAPRGFAKDHPEIELLRHNSLAVGKAIPTESWMFTSAAYDYVAQNWLIMKKWNDWLKKNVRLI